MFRDEIVNDMPNIGFDFEGENNKIYINGNDSSRTSDINNSLIYIRGDNNTVYIRKGAYGVVRIEIIANDCIVDIGEKTGFSGTDLNLWESSSRIIFKGDSIVARDTVFYCTDFHSIVDAETLEPLNQGKEIIVGEHVWVGENVKVLKNTHISNNIIVGAMSVVTRDLSESNSIYAGIPAKQVKKGVTWRYDKFDISAAKSRAAPRKLNHLK